MANTPALILDPTDELADSAVFTVENTPIVVYTYSDANPSLTLAETAVLVRVDPPELNRADITSVEVGGNPVQLDANNTQLTIREPGSYYITKSATANSVGLYIMGGIS